MPVEILGAVVVAQLGVPVRLTVRQQPLGKAFLKPTPKLLADPKARPSLRHAQLYVCSVLGWPSKSTVCWSLETVPPGGRVPTLQGPSFFGAFTLGLARSVVVDSPEAIKPRSLELSAIITDTSLSCVAVSAAFCAASGRFDAVGDIRLKLEALAALPREICRLCVVSMDQDIPYRRVPIDTQVYEKYQIFDQGEPFPILRALDPLDALAQLFLLQGISAV